MKSKDRYDISALGEVQSEPSSQEQVLSNLLGIKDPKEMEDVETRALYQVTDSWICSIDEEHCFTVADICRLHQEWLGEIYEWAGRYRQVNMSKAGFHFAAAHAIPTLMKEFEKKQLTRYTPCHFKSKDEIAQALAEVHVELILIHPFREGNGRLMRLLATLMALQAGLPLLNYEILAGNKLVYFQAIQNGMKCDYGAMKELFLEIISS